MIEVTPLTRQQHSLAYARTRRTAVSSVAAACAICGKGVYHHAADIAYVTADTEVWEHVHRDGSTWGAGAIGATELYGKSEKPAGAKPVYVHDRCRKANGLI